MFDYNKKRYWYHISTELNKYKEFIFYPWGPERSTHREKNEPTGIRIPVAPTLAHCLTALPHDGFRISNIYRTKYKTIAKKPHGIWDSSITKEGWILEPTPFIRVGTIDLKKVNLLNIEDAAVLGFISISKKTLETWKNKDIPSYINFSKNYDFDGALV